MNVFPALGLAVVFALALGGIFLGGMALLDRIEKWSRR